MKKILSILLAVAVTVCFMPEFSFAAAKDRGLPPGVKAEARSSHVYSLIRHQDSEMENIRQQVMDLVDEAYTEFVLDEKYYAAPVYAEIAATYEAVRDKIQKAKKLDELVEDSMFGYMVAADIYESVEMFEYLGSLTIQQGIRGSNALDKLVSDVDQYRKDVFAQYKLYKYNNWYQDVISEFKSDVNAEMSKLKKAPTFAGCAKVRAMIARYDMGSEEYGDEDWIIEIDDGDYNDGDTDIYIDEDKLVYTKEEITDSSR